MDFYSWYMFKPIEKYPHRICLDIINSLKKYITNKIVCDLGCGAGDLLEYIRNKHSEINFKFWKVIFFQILSTLAVIQAKFPEFRHNDLKANNILFLSLFVFKL